MFISRSIALLGVSLIAGCAVGPDYHAPDMAMPSQFVDQASVVQRQASGKAELQRWWIAFDDPLLTHFVGLALEQNLDIAQAAARVAQARASLQLADSALFP